MNITDYTFEIKRHAFIRAIERGITPDMIEATLKGGSIKRFGKNNIKFFKKCQKPPVNTLVACVE